MRYLPYYDQMPYLYYLQGAFMVWMLYDCGRRRADQYWYWIIIGVPFIGPWLYFFMVKAREFGGGLGFAGWSFQRPVSLAELRHQVEMSPTQASHMDLAERLIEEGQHTEAVPHLEAVLKCEPEFSRALCGLAECQLQAGHPEQAAPLLEKVVARDPRWADYQAWILLREVRVRIGDPAGALALCQELVRVAPTLRHKCLLSEQLAAGGQKEEARNVLEKGIEDFRFAPRPIRWRNRQWASQARQLRKRLYQESR
jgi:hypothetical protein